MATYSANEKALIREWNDKWYELSESILGQLFSAEASARCLQGGEHSEGVRYLRLRSWFFDHESDFLQVWRRYIRCGALWKIEITDPYLNLDDIIAIGDMSARGISNPFFLYYRLTSLGRLSKYLGARIGAPNWGPGDPDAFERMRFMSVLGNAVSSCRQWAEWLDGEYWRGIYWGDVL